AMEYRRNQVDLGITGRVARIKQLAGRAEAERLAHRLDAFDAGEGDGEREIHGHAGEDRAEVGGLAMIGVAMEEGDAQAPVGRIDEKRPKPEWRRFRQVFVGIAEAAVDLQRDVEFLARLGGFEKERVAERV